MAANFDDFLKQFGLSADSLQAIRLSRGIVGRTTYALVSLMVVLTAVAARLSPDLLLWLGGLAVLVFVIYFVGVLYFANKNPGAAILEGAELLHWQHHELAAKGMDIVQSSAQPGTTPQNRLEK